VTIFGVPRDSDFDLFVIQQPLKPFGVSWHQTDVNANSHGVGQASVRGVFDVETFSVSPGGTTTFPPTHQYHLGLWSPASRPSTPPSSPSTKAPWPTSTANRPVNRLTTQLTPAEARNPSPPLPFPPAPGQARPGAPFQVNPPRSGQ